LERASAVAKAMSDKAGNEIWILPLDTGCHFSSEFVMTQANAKLRNRLICKDGMTADDS
jgi:ribosomal silencing factor RsfS